MSSPTPSSPQHYFGAAVRRRREALGYSQERLAEMAGIHRNYAGAVERGERNVALVNMVRIAAALGLPLAELVAGIDATLTANPDRLSGKPVLKRMRARKVRS